MADVNANIGVNIDTSAALAQLKALQRQISQFHSSIARSSESAAIAQKSLQKNLLGSINSIGAFSAELRTVRTSAETFTDSLEKNKFGMREYFRYAGASTKTFGRLFKSEFDTIGKVAQERVKTLQTQYIKMGRNASGAMEAIAIRPTSLNMQDYGTRTAIAAQKQALFNQLMKQGTTNLLNFGKNTQWAGRQLMVGFTIPLAVVGSTATKTFMDMEAQAIKFKKVYGDLFTPKAETQAALDDITELGRQFARYGIAVSTTVGLAAEAAAAGFQGLDLQRQTTEATRLSILGQIDTQKALETTISLQNAFGMSSDNLADSINFLNAVENQTVVSLDDITTAIPKVAPIIQQLGGDVKDLAFFLTALKEGGINASQGANALKSGLASLINPTKKASDMLASFGINATEIVEKNQGNLKATVLEFAEALNTLDPLARSRAIEQMFGKFQFARLSTLFANVAKDGNQASRVLDLANASVEELSALSEQELGMTADSAMNKFKKSVEDLKFALIPVGQAFLEAATPIVEFVGGVLEKFGNLSDGTKKLITVLTVGIGAIGPIFLMTFGLLANALANSMKGAMILRQGYLRLTGQSQILGEQTKYLNTEQMEAAAAAHSLDQSHAKLTQSFTAETAALQQLIAAYQSATRAGSAFMLNNPGMMMPPRGAVRKLASGIVSVPGPKGAGDIVPAMLSPGEAVIPAKFVEKYGPLIDGMVAGNIPGYQMGKGFKNATMFLPQKMNELAGQPGGRGVPTADLTRYLGQAGGGSMGSLLAVMSQSLGLRGKKGINSAQNLGEFDQVADLFVRTAIDALNKSGREFVKDIDIEEIVIPALREAAKGIQVAGKDVDLALEKAVAEMRTFGPVGVGSGSTGGAGRTGLPGSYKGQRELAQDYAIRRNPEMFRRTERLSQSRGRTQQYFETYNPSRGAFEPGQMSHLTQSVTATEQELIVKSAPYLKNAGAQITKAITKNITQGAIQQAKVASPSKETALVGAKIAQGFVSGAQEYVDDAQMVGRKLGAGMVQTASGLLVPGGSLPQSGSIAANIPKTPALDLSDLTANARMNKEKLLQLQQAKQSKVLEETNRRFSGFNNKIMGGTFALTSLAGIASMAGGSLGKLSGIVFQLSGVMFALSTVLNILPTKLRAFLLLPGPALAFTAALVAGVGIIKLVNNAREKERLAIEGIGKAANLSATQIEKLAGVLGFTPTKSNLELSKPAVSGLTVEKSKQVEETRKLLAEDKDFKEQISVLKNATSEQADMIFKSLALRLTGQGATQEQITNYIYALQQEAGKRDVKFDLKSIDLSTEEGRAGLQNSVDTLLKDYKTAFDKGFKTRKFLSRTTGKAVEVQDISKNLKTQLSTTANVIANTFMSLDTQLRSGIINADQFNESFNNISNSINKMPKAEGLFLMGELLKILPSELAKSAAGLKNTADQLLIIKAAALGVAVTAEMIQALTIAETDRSAGAQIRASAIRSDLENAMKKAEKVIAELLKASSASAKKEKVDPKAIADQRLGVISNFFNAQEALLRQNRKSKGDALQAEIDLAETAVKSAEQRIDAEEKLVEINQRQIDLLNRRIELEFDRPIQKLQDESSILNNNLEIIRKQEDAINDQYDRQIQALEKISSVNQEIANQEKSRLTIADALTSGDIAAAAAAVQESRAQAAASRIDQQTKALQASREQALAGVSAGGMTKDQIEARTYQIGQQTFLLEQQRKVVQGEITVLQDKNYRLEQGIYSIKQTSLIPAQAQVDKAKEALEQYNKQTDSLVNGIKYLGKTQIEWDAVKVRVEAANSAVELTGLELKSVKSLTKQIFEDWNKIKSKTITITTNYVTGAASTYLNPTKKMYGGKILPMNMGGMVPKYFGNGGKMGSDTVPAMLTPGEFVMNRQATKSFGPLLEMLNESKYPSMIGSSYDGQGSGIGAVTSVNDNSRSVYNYNVGINVPQSNANPNDIARAVIGQIKYIDNQRIRGQR